MCHKKKPEATKKNYKINVNHLLYGVCLDLSILKFQKKILTFLKCTIIIPYGLVMY